MTGKWMPGFRTDQEKYACSAYVFFADKAIVKLMPYDLSRERIVFRAE